MKEDNSIKDFDALAKEEKRPSIRVGGRVFPLPRIPAVASMIHTRYYYGILANPDGSRLDETDMKLQCLVAVLNAGLPENDWISEQWVKDNVPGSIYDDLVDHVLDPLYGAKLRKQERNQKAMMDFMTPEIKRLIQEELSKTSESSSAST